MEKYNKYGESLYVDCGCKEKPNIKKSDPCSCGGISLPSHDNQIEVLIMQLKREVKELMQKTQTRLLCQDKKITETMVYIKNNLSNYIRVLLDSMLQSGELDEIITDTILDSIALLEANDNKLAESDEEIRQELNTEIVNRENEDNNLQSQINGLASGSPIPVSSVSGMTNTSRIYVNTTDGYWYYYNGSAWTQGGVYQATELITDKTLSQENEPADAYVTGNYINMLKDSTFEIDHFNSNEFNQGGISAIGNQIEADHFIRSSAFLNSDIKALSTNYYIYIKVYDKNGNFVGNFNGKNSVSDTENNYRLSGFIPLYAIYEINPNYNIRVVYSKDGNTTTPSDCNEIKVYKDNSLINKNLIETLDQKENVLFSLSNNEKYKYKEFTDFKIGGLKTASGYPTIATPLYRYTENLYYCGKNNFLELVSSIGSPGFVVYFYNGDGSYVDRISLGGTFSRTTTALADYFRIVVNEETLDNFEFYVSGVNLTKSVYNGKTLSIFGDSISTFIGYIPEGNKTYYNGSNCGVTTVNDTWWKKVINATGMELMVNNSWSGRAVSNILDNEEGHTTDAGYKLENAEVLGNDGESPDVIIVQLGINDFNNECPLGEYDGTSELPNDASYFTNAYAMMLNNIMTLFPTSELWVCTLMDCERNGESGFPEINTNGNSISEFNEAIIKLARAFGCKILTQGQCGINYYNLSVYTGDYDDSTERGLHPNSLGHSLMANWTLHEMDASVKTRY